MNFTYEGADTSTIIKKYTKSGVNYHIEYLDGSTSDYVSYNEQEEEKIVNTMIEQVKERQQRMSIDEIENAKQIGLMMSSAAALTATAATVTDRQLLLYLSLTALVAGIATANSKAKVLKELKKYDMFLEIIKDIPSGELQRSWWNFIKVDKLYTPSFDINYLDSHSYGCVKSFYKTLNSSKKTN